MSDFTSSIKEIFNERISSPFYGSLIVSWLLWNWEIPYVTFFVDQDKLGTFQKTVEGVVKVQNVTNKIDYIVGNCAHFSNLVILPLISTVVILAVLPFLTNGAYWITLIFDKWRADKKNEVDKKRLLSLEESLRLTTDLYNQEEVYADIIKSKNDEIESLKNQLKLALKKDNENILPDQDKTIKKTKVSPSEIITSLDLSAFFRNDKVLKYYEELIDTISQHKNIDHIPKDVVKFCIAYKLIDTTSSNTSGYYVTGKGKEFILELMKYQLNNPNKA